MTLEEAESLKPDDIISCAGYSMRIIASCNVSVKDLNWKEKGCNIPRSWAYENIRLVSKAEPIIINNYSIY